MKNILKLAAIIFAVLGIAFLCGSHLASAQGVASQITVLAVVGVICLVIAAALLIVRAVKFPKQH